MAALRHREFGRGTGLAGVWPPPDTVSDVDVRIGVTQAPRELNLEVDDGDRDVLDLQAFLGVTDKRGRELGVPAAKIAYVEVGSADGDRRIGFGG